MYYYKDLDSKKNLISESKRDYNYDIIIFKLILFSCYYMPPFSTSFFKFYFEIINF